MKRNLARLLDGEVLCWLTLSCWVVGCDLELELESALDTILDSHPAYRLSI